MLFKVRWQTKYELQRNNNWHSNANMTAHKLWQHFGEQLFYRGTNVHRLKTDNKNNICNLANVYIYIYVPASLYLMTNVCKMNTVVKIVLDMIRYLFIGYKMLVCLSSSAVHMFIRYFKYMQMIKSMYYNLQWYCYVYFLRGNFTIKVQQFGNTFTNKRGNNKILGRIQIGENSSRYE